jgi:hypothetical protein
MGIEQDKTLFLRVAAAKDISTSGAAPQRPTTINLLSPGSHVCGLTAG